MSTKKSDETEALDVWLRFEHDEDEEPTHEANTYETDRGYAVEHYHTAVGQVSTIEFSTLEEAHAWYAAQGFQDFTS